MATACWASIVAKATPQPAAVTLVFSSLQGTNKEFHPQLVHKGMWMSWGLFPAQTLTAKNG
jgi:hypothetical protein